MFAYTIPEPKQRPNSNNAKSEIGRSSTVQRKCLLRHVARPSRTYREVVGVGVGGLEA